MVVEHVTAKRFALEHRRIRLKKKKKRSPEIRDCPCNDIVTYYVFVLSLEKKDLY